MIAPFAMLPEERIADIRANYAAFRARKDEREAVREQRRCATIDFVPPQSSTVLQSADDVITACEAMKALADVQKLTERAKFAAAQGAGQERKSPGQPHAPAKSASQPRLVAAPLEAHSGGRRMRS